MSVTSREEAVMDICSWLQKVSLRGRKAVLDRGESGEMTSKNGPTAGK